ncbi:gfo/Idh/MocA family oxidoreductase [Maribellus luteus]|uniref:Gfo/Idh/MocA family oxidoreductase n=1 Tax=Maribellus luteus TaxID=2305463 RepID=A0A399T7T1_9BACT|nr:Gfo/Idh/MocA family oxidoreductase [Maribellus luteus]RIJ49993.1 gfo/Idh/MocA family oxidoreductase [Maribellus luteus]
MEEKKSNKISRRDTLKALVTLPVLGYFANRFYVKYENDLSSSDFTRMKLEVADTSIQIPAAGYSSKGKQIRLGIVGNGFRGPQVLRSLGFAEKEWSEDKIKNGVPGPRLQSFLDQEDLNIVITGVCDTFSQRAEEAADIVSSPFRSGGAKQLNRPKIYANYREMLADDNLDAVVILTPDHWHAKMAIDAARAGKHVYLEKPMCQTAEEAKLLRDVTLETGIILQVGHQNRQQASYIMAKEIIDKGVIGPVSLVETYTNRNNDHGAWIRGIPKNANASNINWKEFLGDKAWREMDLDRYFNWQKWFEYGTGPAGNQFTHEFDCVNQVMDLGIPKRVIASGGNYYFNDPRDIPDVFNAIFEYPDRGMSLTYDCTLRNSRLRDKTFLGKDASMEVNVGVAVFPDSQSEKYKKYELESDTPLYTYHPKSDAVDAVTSATAKYYHDRGFGYTYHNGKKLDATYLHVKEWLYCIRQGIQPSCNVNRGFEETTTFYMSNLAYLEKRVVEWDAENEKII